ncbi:hypothetical protein GALL_297470 [mine drainage metagenome]|uniref:Uncharacterized protein n=1 Tax=mine drainage metagenome TaxID=410659 RepID=A0A1J5QYQ4_9ZZZZ
MQRKSAAIRRINSLTFMFVAGIVLVNQLMGYGLPGQALIEKAVEIRAEMDAYNAQMTSYAQQMDGFNLEAKK